MIKLQNEEIRRKLARLTKAELVEELAAREGDPPTRDDEASRIAFFAGAGTEGMLVHQEGRIEDANQAAQTLLQATRERLVGRMVQEYVVGGWHERLGDPAAATPAPVEAIWNRDNGQGFVCECYNRVYPGGMQVLHFREITRYRRPTEERLRLAEEMWDLYNNTPCGYHSLDEHGKIVRMNATELSWLGYDYTQMVGMMQFEKVLTPRSVEYFRRIMPELQRRGWITDLELDMVRRDGSVFPVLVSATAVFDSEGRLSQTRFTVFDTTELKRAGKDLRESEEKFRAIAEQSLMGIFIVQDGRVIYGNESMRRICGYDAQELLDLGPDGFARLIHPADRGLAQRTFARLMLEGDKLPPRDLRGLHKNGHTLWLQLSASHVILRGIPSIFGMVADISERKKTEMEKEAALTRAIRHQGAIHQMATCSALETGDLNASLRVITKQAVAALRAARGSVWLLDEKQNDLACHMLYTREDDCHSRPGTSFGSEDIPHYFDALSTARAVDEQQIQQGGVPMRRLHFDDKNRKTAGLDAAIRHSGEIVGALCLHHVGTARTWKADEIVFAGEAADQVAHALMSHRRKVVELQLRKAEARNRLLNTQLEERVRERTAQLSEAQHQLMENQHRAGVADIATAVLHNVGNILTSVITSGQTIEKTVQTSSIRSMHKANKLLQNLLDEQDPKARKLREFYALLEDLLTKEHEEIHENVEQVIKKIDLIRDVITAQQSFASTDSQSEQLYLADVVEDALNIQEHTLGRYDVRVEKHFHEAPLVFVSRIRLVHVLINLIKNAREAMEGNHTEDRKLDLFVGREGDQVVIKVRDNGHGVAADHLDNLFSHGFSTKKDGHGFGLHSCAKAMTEMGGTIRVESEGVGLGATFVLGFPVPEEELRLDH